MMQPNQVEKNEWSRMAQAAYSADRNNIGHRYSVAASTPRGFEMTLPYFDKLQTAYRAWLVFNEWPAD